MHYQIYTTELPDVILELAACPQMQRLKRVGMNCGCEYTSLPLYQGMLSPYSRYEHSLGVAAIIWHFTENLTQTIAGLFHDIATPIFAHTIDILHKDYEKQEVTERETVNILEQAEEIKRILEREGIPLREIVDYHRYPIADNDSPRLSADRLEYTFGTAYHVHHRTLAELSDIYSFIQVLKGEDGQPELGFVDIDKAIEFTRMSLNNSKYFVCNEDRFAMQSLANIVEQAVQRNVITMEDLYKEEVQILPKLEADEVVGKMWHQYRHLCGVHIVSGTEVQSGDIQASAKKRYIHPLVMIKGFNPKERMEEKYSFSDVTGKRIGDIVATIHDEIDTYLQSDFEVYMRGCYIE